MSRLRISPDLSLPPEVVTSTQVVYGGKGMGKTNFGSVLVEEMTKATLRWSVLDPMGVWWGLRHSPDGKGPGIKCLILGGPHGDIPIEPTAGAVVADLVVDETVNTIIDFSRHANGKMWTKGERIRFVTDYATRLFERQGELVDGRRREPLCQILDEAARYIPQTIPSGAQDLAKCVGAWEQICEEGRNIGLGVAFLTQRSARMNKSVSELADVMYAFRTIGPNSLEAVMDWLGEHVEKSRVRELAAKVRELAIGQALVVSPGWLKVEKIVQMRARETFDSSATPKPGQRAVRVTGQAAAPDLATYQQRMAATIEKAKSDDPKALRAEVTRLTRERDQALKAGASVTSAPVLKKQLDAEYRRGVDDGQAIAVSAWGKRVRGWLGAHMTTVNRALSEIHKFDSEVADEQRDRGERGPTKRNDEDSRGDVQLGNHAKGTGANYPSSSTGGQQSRSTTKTPVTPSPRVAPPANGLSRGQQKVLNALAELEVLGVKKPSRHQLGMVAGYNLTGGSGAQHVADLTAMGYAGNGDGVVWITDDGRVHASADDAPSTLDELHQRVLAKLSDGQRRIAEHLIAIYPESISRAELGAATNYNLTGGSGAQHVADLVTVGAAKIPSKGEVVASDLLFPETLR